VDEVLASASAAILAAGFQKIDYVALRAEETLAPLLQYQSPARLLVAAWLGKTRLIDKILIAPGDFSLNHHGAPLRGLMAHEVY
jgi:pantoate--beta-alanine ligase